MPFRIKIEKFENNFFEIGKIPRVHTPNCLFVYYRLKSVIEIINSAGLVGMTSAYEASNPGSNLGTGNTFYSRSWRRGCAVPDEISSIRNTVQQ